MYLCILKVFKYFLNYLIKLAFIMTSILSIKFCLGVIKLDYEKARQYCKYFNLNNILYQKSEFATVADPEEISRPFSLSFLKKL